MTDPHHWFRLCVDLDQASNPIGASFDLRDGTGAMATHVMPPPEPFEDAVETFIGLVESVFRRYGRQDSLPLQFGIRRPQLP